MATSTDSNADFLETTTLKQLLNVSDSAMEQAMGIAYQLYVTGRLAAAEVVCKGLIGCDHRYWWSHSLHASILQRMGRTDEALRAVDEGLRYQPGQPKLALMRAQLVTALIDRQHGAERATQGEGGVGPSATQPPATHPPTNDSVRGIGTPPV